MKIEDIIYETTREIFNVEDKMRIATIFLFCRKLGSKKLSELLYSENHIQFINDFNLQFKNYDVDFSIDFNHPNVKSAFYKTLEKVKEQWDSNGFLKALYEGDEYAQVICWILSNPFEKTIKKDERNEI